MSKVLFAAIAAITVLVSASVAAGGSPRIQGTVASKFPENHLIRVDSRSQAHVLRVPGSQARIRVGQRVVLRGSTLRQRGDRTRVLARGVTVSGSVSLSSGANGNASDDEVEIKGTLTSLSPLTVTRGARSVTCTVPAATTLATFAVGDLVEMTCDLLGGAFVLRVLKHEDDDVVNPPNDDTDDTTDDDDATDDDTDDNDDDDSNGSGRGGNSGPGGGDD